jgi:hypothetical protein
MSQAAREIIINGGGANVTADQAAAHIASAKAKATAEGGTGDFSHAEQESIIADLQAAKEYVEEALAAALNPP